jgi:hypothetical protein
MSALILACAPVVGRAQTVLFNDDFDAGTSAGRYSFFSADREGTGTFGTGTFVGDTSANFAFNYGAYTYRTTDPNDGVTPITLTIPSAPHSTGGTTIGLRMDVNNANGGSASLQALPKLAEYLGGVAPSGDHKLTFDVFIDYNGHTLGGGGSTEWFMAGINNDMANPAGARVGGEPFGVGKGNALAINGERGNGFDYRTYTDNSRLDNGSTTLATAGYVATTDNVASPPAFSDNGRNAYYQNLFPFTSGYETPGAVGKVWNTVEYSQVDGIIYLKINGNLITARTNDTNTSGGAMLGYADFNNTSAAVDDITGVDANFAVFDNVKVEQVTQSRPTWNSTSGGVWSDGSKWNNGIPDGGNTTADFGPTNAAPSFIAVDGTKTVRSIVFNSPVPYILQGGAINLSAYTQANIDTNPGDETVLLSGIKGTLIVKQGSHSITGSVILNTPVIADISATGALSVADLQTNNQGVEKRGGGVLSLSNVRTTSSVAVNGGTLKIVDNGTDTGVSNVATLTIAGATDAWTGKLDLGNNHMVIDYPAAGPSPLATGQKKHKSGFGTGAWNGNGITSSAAAAAAATSTKTAIGYMEASQLFASFPATFHGQTIDNTALVMQYTLAGDADLSGTVDLTDFTFLAANFNGTGKVWRDGDTNYDGAVDLTDFSFLASNFNKTFAAPASGIGSAVPEPGMLGLLTLASLLAARRRR